jgi:L-seryl-tRNA(Ser) seleniumtransferase
MATTPLDELRARARALGAGDVVDTEAVAGAGSLPGTEIPSIGVALAGDHTAALRAHAPPVIARVRDDTTICDVRTVDPHDDDALGHALKALP